ncbi:sirohydrochlorin cobaltochelatase [Desulfohalobium retbaense]|uniref:Anaerobic cobalt chelatase n=1 Tax=Desulfohalobium retbaense (strain ATCC 49708 / DSM 5692 / JCM 16813 / HR100) TaxID=485915 RepID=C8WZI7_DESRD|nr:sirohydrochlorin cobaltochelatase [Desulfohalobium retbaense]ACV67462.1 anaerobic cobalt chelatase [Desulfohalobium retbaense DSM 5692]
MTASIAIVCTTFGTASQRGLETLRTYQEAVQDRFPQADIHWAFLSKRMRSLRRNAGGSVDSLPAVLTRLSQEATTRIIVHPLQVIPGKEYGTIRQTVRALAHLPEKPDCHVTAPLLWEPASVARLGEALLAEDGAPGLENQLVYMAHGSPEPGHALYVALAHWLAWRQPRILLGSMEYWPTLDDLLQRLDPGTPQLRLIPLLTLIGTHAQRDLAGEEPTSWRSRLTAAGFAPQAELRGLLEKPAVTRLWLERLAEVVTNG